jgi:hypothetical protein
MLRQSNLMGRRLKAACIAGSVAAAAWGLGGCREYFDERDTVSHVAGDAIAVKKATQTIERFPEAARQDLWRSDGERARVAAERYRTRTVQEPQSLGTGDKAAPPAPPQPAAPPAPAAASK